MKVSYLFLLILVLELQNHQAQRILSLMQSCAMHLLGHQLQNLHKNVPGIVDLPNEYFTKVLLLTCVYMCVCVCILSVFAKCSVCI